jgi:hypothetical protein
LPDAGSSSKISTNNKAYPESRERIKPMERAKVLRAIRRKVKVRKGSRAEITGLPFAPGSEVEVIVVGPESKRRKGLGESIYDYTELLTRKKGIPHYSMKQIEEIVHLSREARG